MSANVIYKTNRSKDSRLSEQVGKFMDERFYSKLGEKWNRVIDGELQKRGVDVQFGDCNIDEKVKVKDGYLNRILEYPSFELSFVNRSLKRQNGWFVDGNSLTDYYAFISVYTDAENEYSIERSNISRLVTLFVKRTEIMEYVLNNGIDLGRDIKELSSYEMGDRIDHPGSGIHTKISMQFSEKPINMVVRREILRSLNSTREFDIHMDFIEETCCGRTSDVV